MALAHNKEGPAGPAQRSCSACRPPRIGYDPLFSLGSAVHGRRAALGGVNARVRA